MTTIARWLDDHPDLARLDRELMACDVLGISRARLLAWPDAGLGDAARRQLEAWAERARRGEPLAYIRERREFWGHDFRVTHDVLIPRPETELLVEQAVVLLRQSTEPPGPVLDLGTGSGAIAISIALETAATVTATDRAPAALALAEENARRLGATVRWQCSDWFDQVAGRYRLIVSNPPYVAEHDPHLAALRFEPREALVAGADGLADLRRIVRAAPDHLTSDGWLLLEHGHDQGSAVRALMQHHGFASVRTLPDLAGLDRVTLGTLTNGSRGGAKS